MRFVAVTEGDKTEAELRFGVEVNTWGVNELADAVSAAAGAEGRRLVVEYLDLYDVAPKLFPEGDRHQSLRMAPQSNSGCAPSSRVAGSVLSPPASRTSGRCVSSPAWPSSG